MKLLTAEEVRSKSRLEKDAQAEAVRKNNEEAASSARKVNDAKDLERAELIKIDASIENARKDHEKVIGSLRAEVSTLEKRKEDALQPLKDRELAIEKSEHELVAKHKAVTDAAIEVEEERHKARLAKESYEARMQEFNDKEKDLAGRELQLVKDREEAKTYFQNSTELFKREQTRLREYFEAEDAKLNLIKKHG